jgi:uncharacterized protein
MNGDLAEIRYVLGQGTHKAVPMGIYCQGDRGFGMGDLSGRILPIISEEFNPDEQLGICFKRTPQSFPRTIMTALRPNFPWIGRCLRSLSLSVLPVLLALSLNLAPAWATGIYDLPIVGAGSTTYLIDQADSISLANENRLNGDLKKLAQTTGQEVRFVVIRRLDFDSTIDGFADQLFERWYPDGEAQRNQTLLVLDTLTNSTALRQGEGAQALLTEDIADSLLRETIAVPLKDGAKYNQALIEADKRLGAVLSGQADPGPPTVQAVSLEGTFATAAETDDKSATVWVVVLLALATLIPMVTYFWYVGLPGR